MIQLILSYLQHFYFLNYILFFLKTNHDWHKTAMLLLECTKAELFPQMVLFEHQIYVLWLINFFNCSIDEGKKKTTKTNNDKSGAFLSLENKEETEWLTNHDSPPPLPPTPIPKQLQYMTVYLTSLLHLIIRVQNNMNYLTLICC